MYPSLTSEQVEELFRRLARVNLISPEFVMTELLEVAQRGGYTPPPQLLQAITNTEISLEEALASLRQELVIEKAVSE
jgi:hypothetical protein